MMNTHRWSIALVCVLFAMPAARGEVVRNFAVGNSLTADIMFAGAYDSISAAAAPEQSSSGYHVNCGSSLTRTLTQPTNVCVPTNSYGLFGDAFASTFTNSAGQSVGLDTVFLQPFYGHSLQSEITSVKSLMDQLRSNPLNSDTRVFLYATWSDTRFGGGFYSNWINHQATLAGDFIPSRSTYELMMNELNGSGYEIGLIPAGHAFAAVVESMDNGTSIGGLNGPGDLYRDPVHASNAGKYVGALAAFVAVYEIDPRGQSMPSAPFRLKDYGPELDANGIAAVQEIVWQNHLNVTAVPEPMTSLGLGVIGSGWVLHRARKRRAKAAA